MDTSFFYVLDVPVIWCKACSQLVLFTCSNFYKLILWLTLCTGMHTEVSQIQKLFYAELYSYACIRLSNHIMVAIAIHRSLLISITYR